MAAVDGYLGYAIGSSLVSATASSDTYFIYVRECPRLYLRVYLSPHLDNPVFFRCERDKKSGEGRVSGGGEPGSRSGLRSGREPTACIRFAGRRRSHTGPPIYLIGGGQSDRFEPYRTTLGGVSLLRPRASFGTVAQWYRTLKMRS